MTRTEEKLYVESVFEAIDQAYPMKNHKPTCNYEERLRASFSKLLVPDWYNPDYTSSNGLRKTKSHGHVPRLKRVNGNNNTNNNNNNHHHDDTPDTSVSSSLHSPHLSNGSQRPSYRHRSPSRSWSERPPIRRDSTASSYDANGTVINGRRSTLSNGIAHYAPGVQRVAQSSTWYKPRAFAAKFSNGVSNGHAVEPPKPLPRYSKIDHERGQSYNASQPSKPLVPSTPVRYPLKPRTMAQVPVPMEEKFEQSSLDVDVTLVEELPTSSFEMPRSDSIRSLSSDAESYRSAMLPPTDRNLLATDSSSYASVNERCLSPSTASYHTAMTGDTSSSSSSIAGYETPTPEFDDDQDTLSSHSSLSDISHAETLEPTGEDLDVLAVTITEQKSVVTPSVDINMAESSPRSLPTVDADHLPTNRSRPTDSIHWYEGSLETCIPQVATAVQSDPSEIREISNDEDLREIDLNAVGDEFFLFSPRQTTEDDLSTSITDSRSELDSDPLGSPSQTCKRVFTMDAQLSNVFDDFHCSSSKDPFGFEQTNPSTLMITNLDDIFMNEEDDQELLNATDQFFNRNYRRPIQEDVLYEVEHENSFSDHSQNTSSIVPTDEQTSIKIDGSSDFLTSADHSLLGTSLPSVPFLETPTIIHQQQHTAPSTINDSSILPIYILPPLYTTSTYDESTEIDAATSLNIDTTDNLEKWDALIHHMSDFTSPSMYTSKIRNRHYSVGSYYDHKSTTVALHTNHTLYLLGSAPVSPLSRTSPASGESHYHHSPISYENIPLNSFRRVNPFVDANRHSSSMASYEQSRTIDHQLSTASRNENTRSTTKTFTSPNTALKSMKTVIPTISHQAKPIIPQPIVSPQSIRTTSVTFSQYEIPSVRPKNTIPPSRSPPPPPPPPRPAVFHSEVPSARHHSIPNASRSPTFEEEKLLIRPKTSRGPPPIPPTLPRTLTAESDSSQNIYQEIDRTGSSIRRKNPPNADLQFIRGAIERVFDFHGGSATDTTSESSTHYEEVCDDQVEESISSTTISKKSNQYPAVEAIQRFYNHKTTAPANQITSTVLTTNLDDTLVSNSSISNKMYAQSPPVPTRTKSSEHERASSEEVDDTLNDIEDVDEHESKRQQINHSSSHTSHESSPSHSSLMQVKHRHSSQETQTIEREKPLVLMRKHLSHSPSPVRSSVPPIDIVTQMVIEQDDDQAEIDDVSGDMVIFYDDIEIVEHSTSSYSTESDSASLSHSSSDHYSKPRESAPPIPARTLKPSHLANHQPISTTINKTYELEKCIARKKFDVNSVNDMLNRTDQHMPASITHRHPSARHFVGKLNTEDASLPPPKTQPHATNGHQSVPTKIPFATVPPRSSSALGDRETQRSTIADTTALVKHIQNSLSRSSLHDKQISSNLSTSSKDLRAFVSATYSPSEENVIDDGSTMHPRELGNGHDDQQFKRQARLSKSFHNVSEYNSTDQYPKKEAALTSKNPPSKSVENHLDQVTQRRTRPVQMPLIIPSVVAGTSFSTLPASDENPRMMSMKWYTGHVSENSEISYEKPHLHSGDLLHGYISTHGNEECQAILARLLQSNDSRVQTALDDIRSRVAEFDASKTQDDLPGFMVYLESRLRGINSTKTSTTTAVKQQSNGRRSIPNQKTGEDNPVVDTISIKSRTSSGTNRETSSSSSSRQLGRQQLRSSVSTGGSNGHHPTPPRRSSQSSSNQENPAVLDEMLNTVLGLPRKAGPAPPSSSSSFSSREKSTPLLPTQMTTNTAGVHKTGRDVGKRLFESGTFKDPRLIYDGPKKPEKEEEPLETSV